VFNALYPWLGPTDEEKRPALFLYLGSTMIPFAYMIMTHVSA
jgi:hypothetical protein